MQTSFSLVHQARAPKKRGRQKPPLVVLLHGIGADEFDLFDLAPLFDPRCVVVATRTEIDWAMKHGQTIVWAPSKLVLDAVDGPHSREPVALALWLAELTAADGFVVHGSVTVPAGSRVTIERA